MALNKTTIRASVVNAVKTKFETQFDAFPEGASTEDIAIAMSEVVAEVVEPIIDAIILTADLAGVTAGTDTVNGSATKGIL